MREVALTMQSFVCLPGDVIVRAGDRGHEMYVLARGEVEAVGPDGRVLRTLHAGDFFGEIALVLSDVRTATITATAPSDLYVLSAETFARIAEDYPEVAATLRAEAERRRQRRRRALTAPRRPRAGPRAARRRVRPARLPARHAVPAARSRPRPDVARLPIVFVNAYLVGAPGAEARRRGRSSTPACPTRPR